MRQYSAASAWGWWMSRSSFVWGPFSVVWGMAIVLATVLLYKDRERPDRHIFLIGTFLGGVYEYVCSVLTEIVFGKVFWDYSKIPFNLGEGSTFSSAVLGYRCGDLDQTTLSPDLMGSLKRFQKLQGKSLHGSP